MMISCVMIVILGFWGIDYAGSGKPNSMSKLVSHDSTFFADNH